MTPTQTLNEIMKGCRALIRQGKYMSELSLYCGDILDRDIKLCPSCQSRLTQFKDDLKMFKEMIESRMPKQFKNIPLLPLDAVIREEIEKRYLASISEVLKEMGE